MDFKLADLLINSYANAAERTRKVFITLNIVSIIFFIAFFNYNYSWLRHKEMRYVKDTKAIMTLERDTWKLKQANYLDTLILKKLNVKAREKLLVDKYQVEHRFINFDLIGAKIYIEDLPLLGSIALAILLTWFFYSNRRETGIIKEISRRISSENDVALVDYLFIGTSFNLIFNTIKNVDEQLTLWQLLSVYIRRALLFLPTLILFWVTVTDGYETFFGNHTWEIFTDFETRFEMVIRTVTPLFLLFYCYVLTKSVLDFSKQDSEYRDKIQDKYIVLHGELNIQSK